MPFYSWRLDGYLKNKQRERENGNSINEEGIEVDVNSVNYMMLYPNEEDRNFSHGGKL